MEKHETSRDVLASRSLFLLDTIYVIAAIGQIAIIAIAVLGDESVPRLTFLLEAPEYTLFQLLLFECILLGWITIALGAWSLSCARTSLTTTRGALAHVVVCFFPLAFVIHYFTLGRRTLRSDATRGANVV